MLNKRNRVPVMGTLGMIFAVGALLMSLATPAKSAESAERFFVNGVSNLSFSAFMDGLKACRDDGNEPGSGCHLRVTYMRYSQILQGEGNAPSGVDLITWLEENTKVGKPAKELTLYGIEGGRKLVTNTRPARRGEMIVYDKSDVPILSLGCANPFPKIKTTKPVELPVRTPPLRKEVIAWGNRQALRQTTIKYESAQCGGTTWGLISSCGRSTDPHTTQSIFYTRH